MDFSTEKKELRTRLRRLRREIPAEERAAMDAALFRNITQSPWYEKAELLLLYVSAGGEAGTLGVLEHALAQGKRVALPKCGTEGRMRFLMTARLESLRPGAYGIPEPTGTETAEITEKTVCFVPGISFTRQGNRLGQGGGYYDRFMQEYPFVYCIGICYDFQLLETLPSEAHDRCVQAIITEKTVEVCNGIQF